MLPKMYYEIEKNVHPILKKYLLDKDVSGISAFPCGSVVDFEVTLPRREGFLGAVMRIRKDGEDYKDLTFDYIDGDGISDVCRLSLDTKQLCKGDENGLFFYEILFLRAENTLFSDSLNNVDFELNENSAYPFHLLVYSTDFTTPEWFKGRTMYQIFVDRFAKGTHKIKIRDGAELNEDWDNGIPQFAENPGDRLANNVFFGGDLYGVADKLPYLKELGVGVIYLCPIFESVSNHKYDTGDYEKIDSMFGGEKAFDALISKAQKCGIKIILDGVFNHTGDNSKYFNKYGKYDSIGAFQSENSEYHSWYSFKNFPDEYDSWWGIDILPRLNHANPECRHYFTGSGGIAEKYIKKGISGWRIDVADELSNTFLNEFRTTVKSANDEEKPIIIGEVWENAVEKIAYGKRRKYFNGNQLDSVMNYPLKNAIIDFINTGDSEIIYNTLVEIYSSYPKCVCDSLMNILGTHDTERILTVFGDETLGEGLSNSELSEKKLSRENYAEAVEKLKLASVIQYTVYGVPSLYYGDEIGSEGYRDPFCRMPFAWNHINCELLGHYKLLGKLRKENPVFKDGDFEICRHDGGFLEFVRRNENEKISVAINISDSPVKMSQKGGFDLCKNKKISDKTEPTVGINKFRIIKYDI